MQRLSRLSASVRIIFLSLSTPSPSARIIPAPAKGGAADGVACETKVFTHIVALLLSLPALADRAANLPHPVRWVVLRILRRAEIAGRDFVIAAARAARRAVDARLGGSAWRQQACRRSEPGTQLSLAGSGAEQSVGLGPPFPAPACRARLASRRLGAGLAPGNSGGASPTRHVMTRAGSHLYHGQPGKNPGCGDAFVRTGRAYILAYAIPCQEPIVSGWTSERGFSILSHLERNA